MRPPDGHTAVHHTAEQEAEHIHRIEEAGYTSAVPIGDGFMESAVAMAPPHERLSMERRASSVEAMEETARIEDDIGPPPDGGRQAWLTVLAGFLQQFCIFGMINCNGNLQAYYLANQLEGYQKPTVAWIGSVQSFVEFAFALITGRYLDVHGPVLLVSGATVLGFAATIGMAFSYKFYQFFLSFFLFGIAGTLTYAPSGAIVSHWFAKRRSLAVGIVVCGSSVGGLIYPIMLEQLFVRTSYRNTMLIIGAMNFVLMAPGVFWMKTRLPPRRPPPLKDMLRPWHEPKYVVHVIGSVLYGMNILAPFFTAISYATENGLPDHIASYAVTICMSGSIVGRIAFGLLADRFGVWRIYGTVGFISSIVMFAFWLPPMNGGPGAEALTIIGLLSYGVISGSWFTLVPSATAAISPVHEAGMRFGMLITVMAIPSLVGPVITSALIEAGNNRFTYGAVWVGCCTALSGLVTNSIPFAEWVKRRRGWGKEEACSSVESTAPTLEEARIEEKPEGVQVTETSKS